MKKSIKTAVKVQSEFDVKEAITRRIEKVVEDEINKASKEYYRTISVNVNIEVE